MSKSNVNRIDSNNSWIPQPSTNLIEAPRIIEYTPSQGKAGDYFKIDIQHQNLAVDIHLLKIAFHSCITTCHFSLNTVTQVHSIHTQVPDSNLIHFNDLWKVPVYLAVVQEKKIADSWLIGYFSYHSRKKTSSDLDNNSRRPRSDQQQGPFTSYYVSMPYVGLPPTQPSPRPNEYFEDPLLNYSNPFNHNNNNEPNFISAEPSSVLATGQSSFNLSSSTSPPSQLLMEINTSSSPMPHPVNKPNLILEGDLSSLVHNWTEDERRNSRRLVQFWRHQVGNDIICNFEPFVFSQQVDINKLILVSCILWQGEYYITSVDCITLFERLIGVKFTVEEKNRIRRNLEEYRPMTVSKVKPETIDFFKLIMGFPSPKPRNIEKGVKVYPWQTLSMALHKIINKYTASYSSTASYDV